LPQKRDVPARRESAPAPVITTARTEGSPAAASRRSASRLIASTVRAFIASGRLSVRGRTPSDRAARTASLMHPSRDGVIGSPPHTREAGSPAMSQALGPERAGCHASARDAEGRPVDGNLLHSRFAMNVSLSTPEPVAVTSTLSRYRRWGEDPVNLLEDGR